jgi:histone H3/H4
MVRTKQTPKRYLPNFLRATIRQAVTKYTTSAQIHFDNLALEVLRSAAEAYISSLHAEARVCAGIAGRSTVLLKDFQLARRMCPSFMY